MADLYGLEQSGIDPEIAAQMLGLKRRRDIAALMQQQGMAGIEQPQTPHGGYTPKVSPLSGIAKVLQAYMGAQMGKEADTEQAKLMSENQRRSTEAMAGYEQQRRGTPELAPIVRNDDEGNQMPNVSATPGDPRKAIADLLMKAPQMGNNPLVKGDIASMQKGNDPYTLTAGSQRFGPDNKPLAQAGFKPDRVRPPMNDFQIAQLKDMVMKGADMGMDVSGLQQELAMAEAARAAIKLPAAPAAPNATPVAPVVPPEVIAAAQKGPMLATQAPGGPVQFQTPPGLAPRDARAVAVDKAKTQIELDAKNTERTNKRGFGMEGLGATIKEARDLLGKNPTGSGAGNIYDNVAGFFGASPAGSEEAQALKAVGGALVSKMPRMEGPQSDKDTQNYKEMAALVGDPTIPVKRRLAALDRVEALWAKYEPGNKTSSAGLSAAEEKELADLRARFKR